MIPIGPPADQGHWQACPDQAEETLEDAEPPGPSDEARAENGRRDPLVARRPDQRLRTLFRRSVRPQRPLGMRRGHRRRLRNAVGHVGGEEDKLVRAAPGHRRENFARSLYIDSLEPCRSIDPRDAVGELPGRQVIDDVAGSKTDPVEMAADGRVPLNEDRAVVETGRALVEQDDRVAALQQKAREMPPRKAGAPGNDVTHA